MPSDKQKEVQKETPSREKNHAANPPGDPMLKQRDEHGQARLKELAAIEEADADQTAHVRQQNLPIKQPNKVTNDS